MGVFTNKVVQRRHGRRQELVPQSGKPRPNPRPSLSVKLRRWLTHFSKASVVHCSRKLRSNKRATRATPNFGASAFVREFLTLGQKKARELNASETARE